MIAYELSKVIQFHNFEKSISKALQEYFETDTTRFDSLVALTGEIVENLGDATNDPDSSRMVIATIGALITSLSDPELRKVTNEESDIWKHIRKVSEIQISITDENVIDKIASKMQEVEIWGDIALHSDALELFQQTIEKTVTQGFSVSDRISRQLLAMSKNTITQGIEIGLLDRHYKLLEVIQQHYPEALEAILAMAARDDVISSDRVYILNRIHSRILSSGLCHEFVNSHVDHLVEMVDTDEETYRSVRYIFNALLRQLTYLTSESVPKKELIEYILKQICNLLLRSSNDDETTMDLRQTLLLYVDELRYKHFELLTRRADNFQLLSELSMKLKPDNSIRADESNVYQLDRIIGQLLDICEICLRHNEYKRLIGVSLEILSTDAFFEVINTSEGPKHQAIKTHKERIHDLELSPEYEEIRLQLLGRIN